MDEKKVKELFENMDVNKLKSGVESLMTKVNPMLEKMMNETQKLVKPKAKKNISLNGKQVSLSLIEDGRLLISFPTLDEATKCFEDALSFEDKKAFGIFIESNEHLTRELNMLKSKWWYKFFSRFQ